MVAGDVSDVISRKIELGIGRGQYMREFIDYDLV
jgi:hypothetical protein